MRSLTTIKAIAMFMAPELGAKGACRQGSTRSDVDRQQSHASGLSEQFQEQE